MTTDNSKELIQNAIVSAVEEDAEEDGSFLLFNGRSVPLQLIYKDQHGHKNTRSVSIKGTLYHNKKRLVCIVAIRYDQSKSTRRVLSLLSMRMMLVTQAVSDSLAIGWS
jgi:hypothetical protein